MSSYWAYLARQLPELELLPDDAARREVFAMLQKRFFARSWRFWLYWAVFFVLALGSVSAGFPKLAAAVNWIGLPHWFALVVVVLALIVAFYIGIGLFWERPMTRAVRRELVGRGIRICVNCGYDCRAQQQPRCPECGREPSGRAG
ncbi:MAG: hypothetical protein IPM64_05705 [Phycisphaerales bacterium]|nr:hypothetical protein [Phycisphaerales bacterium]